MQFEDYGGVRESMPDYNAGKAINSSVYLHLTADSKISFFCLFCKGI